MVPQLGAVIATELAPVLSSSATQGLACVVDGFVNACKIKNERDIALARISAQLETSLAEIRSSTEKSLKVMDIFDKKIQSLIMECNLPREDRMHLIQAFADNIVNIAIR